MNSSAPNRLEWISFVYLFCFVLAVLSPSLYQRGYFGLSETTLEELTIFAFGVAGLLTFVGYERVMESREKEKKQAEVDFQRAKTELIESYQYIGSINRKIELLKRLSNDAYMHVVDQKKVPKDLFQALAANAAAVVDAQSVLIRVVELDKVRTDREFSHHVRHAEVFRVSNRELRAVHENNDTHAFIQTEDEKQVLVVPSDKNGPYKVYLLFAFADGVVPDIDVTLLKVLANQAEMLYHHFYTAEPSADAQESIPVV